MNSDQSYWLVGASWDGVDHQDKKFVDNKIWVLGYKEKDDESQYLKAKKIKKGDRIAIKRMMGKGSANIKILHTGIVEGVVDYGSLVICVVNWLVLEKRTLKLTVKVPLPAFTVHTSKGRTRIPMHG